METLAERAESKLMDLISRFAAGEAEVVHVYFAGEHTREEHLDALIGQMGRELQTRHWLHRALVMNDGLEESVDRHEFLHMIDHIYDEMKHYTLLADLAEWLAGRKLSKDELMRYEIAAVYDPVLPEAVLRNERLPEATKMVEIIREACEKYGDDYAIGVLRLSEGGGGGAFVACAQQTGDEYARRLAEAMGSIVRDEMGHGPGRVRAFVQEQVKDEATLDRTYTLLEEYMWQHLRLRNEIWGNPLSEERMAAIRRGEITPMALDLAGAAS
jgi:hypothetical protein